MAQFARPDSNVTQTSFTGGFAEIDEATASDADFAYGANNTAAELEVGLSNPTDPSASTGHIFRYRIARTNAGTVDGGGNAVTVTARLMQGATQIATDTAKTTTGTWTQYAYTLSGAEADAITDYTDLRLEFVTSASGGGPSVRRGGAVSWAELEVPDAAAPTGSGSTTVPSATVSGTGSHAENATGTGAVTGPSATVAGVGAEVFTGGGAATGAGPAGVGSGALVLTATGAITVPTASVVGVGAIVLTATGALGIPAPAVAGSGAEVFTASGSIAVPMTAVVGSGAEVLTATGAMAAPSATVAGTGSHSGGGESHSATGATTVPAAVVAGSGTLALSGNLAPTPGVVFTLNP